MHITNNNIESLANINQVKIKAHEYFHNLIIFLAYYILRSLNLANKNQVPLDS